MQEQEKCHLPHVAAVYQSNLSVPIGLSSTSSLTTFDIKAIIQQFLLQTSIAISITSSNRSGLFDITCCNHTISEEFQFSEKALLAHLIPIYIVDGTLRADHGSIPIKFGLNPNSTRSGRVGDPQTDCRSPRVESERSLKSDRSIQLKLMNGGNERRRTERCRISLEESKTSLI